MRQKNVKIYLNVAETVANYKSKYSTDLHPYTCIELWPSGVCGTYKAIFELNIIEANEQDLWNDTSEFRKERRLLMLCLAAAIEASGGL